MSKYCFIFPLILLTILVKGQDVITLNDGNQIKCKVIEVDTNKIKYLKFPFLDSNIYSLKKSDYSQVYFQPTRIDKGGLMSKQDLMDSYKKGASDARKYYGSLPIGGGTAVFYVSVLFGGLGGLIPAVACASTPPQEKNLHLPPTALKDNKGYMTGYRTQAYRIKRGKIWLNFGVGAVLGGITSVLLSHVK